MTSSEETIQVKPRTRRVGKIGGDELCCVPSTPFSLSEREATDIAALLRALADPTRLQIVTLLAEHPGEECVCDITGRFHLDQSTISHHLRVLREAGIVSGVKHGVWSYYFLQTEVLQPLLQVLQRLGSCCQNE